RRWPHRSLREWRVTCRRHLFARRARQPLRGTFTANRAAAAGLAENVDQKRRLKTCSAALSWPPIGGGMIRSTGAVLMLCAGTLALGSAAGAQSAKTFKARLAPVPIDVTMQATISGSGSVS